VVALIVVSALAGTGLARLLRGPALDDPRTSSPPKTPGQELFRGWDKPDLVLVLSGQQHGYVLPCGCSSPQVGGLERRYNFLQSLKKRGWPVVAVDLGDVPQNKGPMLLPNLQGLIKYRYSMMALKEMGYTAVSLGEYEASLKLTDVLAEYALQYETPRVVVANLIDAEKNYPSQTRPWQLADPKSTPGLRVGVTGVVGVQVATTIKKLTNADPKVRFWVAPAALDAVLKQMSAEKVDLPILLYQGPVTRGLAADTPTEAMACAAAYPQFPFVVCLTAEDDPPSQPIDVANKAGGTSRVVLVGQKGKHLGVVGVWKTGKADRPFDFRYERVKMGEEWLTPAEKEETHPILRLMEDYTLELKNNDYLARYGQIRHFVQALSPVPGLERPGAAADPTYVGSEKCKRCHESAYDVWKNTPHSHAYRTLVEAKRPSNRQYDPECIVCHTVGFGYQGGFTDAKKTPQLKDVGCESCHGPASLHVINPNNAEWQRRLNPWKLPADATAEQKAKMRNQIDQFCQKCHDIDNDVTWIHGGFERKWPKIDHPSPKAGE
jgi:hypothetical protein